MVILQKLPNLSSVRYTSEKTGIKTSLPLISTLSTVAQEILAEPDHLNGHTESDGHFWTLLQSAYHSGHAQQLTDIRGSHLQLDRWNSAAMSSIDCYRALSALSSLSLDFDFAQHAVGGTTQLADMIAHASSLASLRLSFDFPSWEEPNSVIRLPQVIGHKIQWKHLESLFLQGVVTTEGFLRNLLLRHS